MNPDDNGEAMTPAEMANEQYIGAMQNVCDAVERWFDVQVSAIELAPVRAAQEEMADAMFAYEQRRDEMHAANRAEAARVGL